MSGPPISRCKSCNAPIIWAKTTKTGRMMPVDAEPHLGGNVVVLEGPEARVLTRKETDDRRARGIPARTSHFSTCPQATSHRRAPAT